MKPLRIVNTILNIPDSDKVTLITFNHENNSNEQTEYLMFIYYSDGNKTVAFLGNTRERALELYNQIIEMLFPEVIQMAK